MEDNAKKTRCCRNCTYKSKMDECTTESIGFLKATNATTIPPFIPQSLMDTYFCKEHRFANEKRILNE